MAPMRRDEDGDVRWVYEENRGEILRSSQKLKRCFFL